MKGDVPVAGAYPRDVVDSIMVEEVKSGSAFLGTAGSFGKGPKNPALNPNWGKNSRDSFPAYSSGSFPADSDKDGMPNSWETAKGLNPNDPSDAHSDRDGDGYYNIEEYINSFFLIP